MNWEDEEPVEYVSLLVLQYFPTKLLEFSWKYFFLKGSTQFFNTFFNSWKYGAHFLIFYVTCSSETSRKICTKEDEGALIKKKRTKNWTKTSWIRLDENWNSSNSPWDKEETRVECLELHDDKFVQIYSMETEESVSFVFEETTSFLRVHRVYALEYSGFFFLLFTLLHHPLILHWRVSCCQGLLVFLYHKNVMREYFV